MKKLTLLFALLIFLGCSKDSDSQDEPNLNGGDTLEQVVKTNSEAVSKLNELLIENNLINSLEKLKVWLESSPNISEADISDGDVEIKYNSGLSSFIIISLVDEEGNKTKGGGISKSNKSTLVKTYNESTMNIIDNSTNHISGANKLGLMGDENLITDRDVLIYDAFQFHFNTGEGQEIKKLFESSSLEFSVNYLKDEQCTLNSLNDITKYGFIYLCTHGENGNIIWTREKAERLDIDKWPLVIAQKLKFGTIVEFEYTEEKKEVVEKGDFWGVTSNYISDINGVFPKSIIFNSSCEGTKTNKLYNAFKSKNAKTYLGFDKSVMSDFSKYAGVQFVRGLLKPLSATGDAFNGIVSKKDIRVVDPIDPSDATIEMLGEDDMTFFDISVEIVSGDNQTGNQGEQLSEPLKVKVLGNSGLFFLKDIPVYFNVTSGNGTVNNESVLTDENGFAEVNWTLGDNTDSQAVEVTVKKADGTNIESMVTFNANSEDKEDDLTGCWNIQFNATTGNCSSYNLDFLLNEDNSITVVSANCQELNPIANDNATNATYSLNGNTFFLNFAYDYGGTVDNITINGTYQETTDTITGTFYQSTTQNNNTIDCSGNITMTRN